MDDGYETARSLPELLDQRPLGRLLRAGSRRIGMWRIGILMSASENDTGYQGLLATFRYELKKLGREEGRNIRMRRREFLGVLSGAAALPLIPFAACAQQTMPVIGLLTGFALEPVAHLIEAFRRGLKETDFVEGQNVVIEYRSADGDYERLPALAADLVHRRVSVIVAIGPPSALATKAATTTIPFVFTSGGDVVKSGLVISLNRPGGNATGVNLFTQAVEAKKLEMISKLLSTPAMIAFLVNASNPAAEGKAKEMQDAALVLGRKLLILHASGESDIDIAFATLAQLHVGALVVGSDPYYDGSRRAQFIALAARYLIPTIYGQREYVTDGGLISYGTSLADAYRQAGIYAGRILKGEKPAELPVVQPTRFELVINLKTARTLGLDIPPNLLTVADEVIE
jgi:putative ABC transport system substrate-binding protein